MSVGNDTNLNDADTVRQLLNEENDAIISYRERANNVSNPKVKAVLLNIANEEVSHTGELQQVLSDIDGTNDKLVEDGKEEVKDMDDENIEKAYRDFAKSDQEDQPNKTSVEDKLDVLLAQNQEIKVDTERTADAVAQDTAGNNAENDAIADDFENDGELDGLEEGEDFDLSDDIGGESEEPMNEGSDTKESDTNDSDIEESETEKSDDVSDIEESDTEDSDIEESDNTDGESSDNEQSYADEESDVLEDESEVEEPVEESDKKKEELEKALRVIDNLRKENLILKAKLKKQSIAKSDNTDKPMFKRIKPMDNGMLKTEMGTTRPSLNATYGRTAIRPQYPDDSISGDEELVVGIGKDYKSAMTKEWDSLFNNKVRNF